MFPYFEGTLEVGFNFAHRACFQFILLKVYSEIIWSPFRVGQKIPNPSDITLHTVSKSQSQHGFDRCSVLGIVSTYLDYLKSIIFLYSFL